MMLLLLLLLLALFLLMLWLLMTYWMIIEMISYWYFRCAGLVVVICFSNSVLTFCNISGWLLLLLLNILTVTNQNHSNIALW